MNNSQLQKEFINEVKRIYIKNWRKNNKDKTRQYCKTYRSKNLKEEKERYIKWYFNEENHEIILRKKRIRNNKRVHCENCGKEMNYSSLYRHRKIC